MPPTWHELVLFPPLPIFGISEESGGGPGEGVVGQSGVLLSDEQGLEEAFGCLLIILDCDLRTSRKSLFFF